MRIQTAIGLSRQHIAAFIIIGLLIAPLANCLALTNEEYELAAKTKYLKERWEAAEIVPVVEGQQPTPDPATAKKLQELFQKSLDTLLEKAFEPAEFEEQNTLWHTCLYDPVLNPILTRHTLANLNEKTFPPERKKKILDIIISCAFRPELKESLRLNLDYLAKVAEGSSLLTNAQRSRIVEYMMANKNPRISLLLYESFTPTFAPATTTYFEKLAAKANEDISKIHFRDRYWLAVSILAHQGQPGSIEKLKSAALRIGPNNDNDDVICIMPFWIAYSRQPELLPILLEMLKSNIAGDSCDDTIPSRNQLSHSAAVALSSIIEGFPKYLYHQEFTAQDKKLCLDWVQKHKNACKIIPRSSGFFREGESLLEMHCSN